MQRSLLSIEIEMQTEVRDSQRTEFDLFFCSSEMLPFALPLSKTNNGRMVPSSDPIARDLRKPNIITCNTEKESVFFFVALRLMSN